MIGVCIYQWVKKGLRDERGHLAAWLYMVIAIAMPLSSVVNVEMQVATHGLSRYLLPAFPFFLYWGSRLYDWYDKKQKWRFGVFVSVWTFIMIVTFLDLAIRGFTA